MAGAGAVVCAAIALTGRTNDHGPAGRAIKLAGRADVFGPGILQTVLPAPLSTLHPPGEATIDEKGNLLIDAELLQLLDYFLLHQGEDGPAALEQYLATALPEPARQQAIDIARRYRAYMAEHDRQLAAQRAGLNNLSRVAAWVAQRDRLRSATIGDVAARAWYQNDDAQMQQAVFELSNSESMPNAEAPGVPHWQNSEDAARHQRYLQQTVERNLLSYTARKALAQRPAANDSP